MCTIQPMQNINIGKVCRACFEICEQYKMLYESAETTDHRTLGDIFFDVVKIETKTDIESSPSRICIPCSQDLVSAYNFIKTSQQNEDRLRDYFKSSSIIQPDCLSEFPIDIPNQPNVADALQIKVENELINEYVEPPPEDNNPPPSSSESAESEGSDYEDEAPLHKESKINKMQCTYCGRIFKRLDFLENHKRKHEEELNKKEESGEDTSTLICDECGINCDSKLELKTHRLTEHPPNSKKRKRQPRCHRPKEKKRETRKQNKNKAAGRFECDTCGKTFAWKKDLGRHEKCHEPNNKKYACPHCERRFIRKDKLTSHLLVHLAGVAKSRPLRSIQYYAHNLFSGKKFLEIKCMLCNFDKASNVRELRRHISLHNNLEVLEELGNSNVVKRFYPDRSLQEVIPLIAAQIENNRFEKLHSIVNANTYEMGISDSNESDTDTEYMCEACVEPFNRKHKLMTHQAYEHTFDECPYKCDNCQLKFTCKQVFESHLKHHCENPDKEFKCKECPGRFTWPENLENHKCSKKVRIDKEKTICEVCDKSFPTPKEMRMHKKSHIPDNKSFNCSVCGEKYIRLANLRRHLKMHTEKHLKSMQPKRLQCLLCDAEFQSLRNLKTHIFTHSDGQTNVNFKCCEQFVNNFYPEADENDISEHIQRCFSEQKLWRLYIAVNKFNLEMVLSDSDSDDDEFNQSPKESYICELCDLKFDRMQAILRHQYIEHDSKKTSFPHKCDRCSDQFICQALLSRHQKSECINVDRIHACVKCGVKYTWKQNLVGHSCQKEDSKKCEVCGRKFNWQKDLYRHKRTHIPDDKKFECLVCEKKFSRKDNMRSHMRTHDTDNKMGLKATLTWEQQDENLCRPHGDKCIECKICLAKHDTIRELASHLRTHKDSRTLRNQEAQAKDISMLLYGKEMELDDLSEAIKQDLLDDKNAHFYSITNEMGYELTLIDSETGSELEVDDNTDDDDDELRKGYNCSLCNKTFNRKFKMFEHQRAGHSWDELPFECEHCSAKFVCESIYDMHLQHQCENKGKKFKCKRCPLKFTWRDNLKYHEKYIHDKQPILPKKYHCRVCEKSFQARKDYLRHKKIHEPDEEFECTWCFRIFMRRDNLKVHMKVHQNATHLLLPDIYYLARPNGAKIADCKLCDQKFTKVSALLEHIRSAHSKHQKQATTPNPTSYSITNALGYEMDIEDSETEKEDTIEKYSCDVCNTRFNRRFKLLKHQQALHYSDNIPHKCNYCNFKCVSEAVLNYHMRTQCMNETKQYHCSRCTMRFMWQENLENHESLIHDSPRTHTCDVCKRDFATQHDLKSHSDCKPPTEVKFYECKLCDRKYNRKDRLMKHVKVHDVESKKSLAKTKQSSDKKYLCAFCGKEVSSSSNLVIHMRRHTGEKPFKCEFCNKGFPRSSDLSCHRRTHTGERPHKCTVCEKAFSRSYKLQTHMRIHSGEKPYKCTYCDKSFTQSNDLTLHVRRHTGERPYTCETCGERFIQGTALRNHRRMRGHYQI